MKPTGTTDMETFQTKRQTSKRHRMAEREELRRLLGMTEEELERETAVAVFLNQQYGGQK